MLKLEDVLKVLEENSISEILSEELNETAHEFMSLKIADSEIVRIEGDAPFHWSGVRNCNNDADAQVNYKAAIAKWVQKKMFEHRDWRWVRYGAKSVEGRCTQYTPGTFSGGSRSCLCRGVLKCYIEFRKP